VQILELARNMIRLSGKVPDTEIPIAFVGVRPGEKLHEELWTAGETVGPTSHPKILRAARPPIDVDWLDEELTELGRMVERGDTLDVVSKLAAMLKAPRRAGAAVLEDTLH
jgi:FlaA1/EpsC-like NDP-sugar epimerase